VITGGEKMSFRKVGAPMIFNLLVKKEDDTYVAHCLELDIVATSRDLEQVKSDMVDLIKAQVDYAFSNNNLAHLYHPAPPEVWQEFYACKHQIEEKTIRSAVKSKTSERFIPPWIVARTCELFKPCHA
jgi:hypothetical protein